MLRSAVILFLILTQTVLAATTLAPTRLRTEYLVNPLATDETHPRLSWIVESAERGAKQTAYRIVVTSGVAALWDTGKVTSGETVNIVYAGKPLAPSQRCDWKVQIWNGEGKTGAWSAPASWQMGLKQWKAEWISYKDDTPVHTSRQQLYLPPPRHYRKSFAVAKKVRHATLYASALGIFDAYVNGKRVSDAMFSPGWSDYRKRAYYRAFDVTSLLSRGDNAIGAIVAEGWYSGYVGYGLLVGYGPYKTGRSFYGKTPALLAQIEVEMEDGSRMIVATDKTWKVSTGPELEADLIMGESYDARKEIAGWDRAGFDDSKWTAAIAAAENPQVKAPYSDKGGDREIDLSFVKPAKMQAYSGPPVRPIQEIRAVKMSEPSTGVYIFDLGQNFSGVARLKVRGAAGTKVRIRFGEMLHGDGRLMTENLRKARATDTYILKGGANGETWTPRFTYHGFQYVELTGLAAKPALDAVTGVVVHSDTPLTSKFSSSDEMANQLFRNIVWTQRSNFVELPTDCPQRDERLGWTGDAQTYARAATYNADTASFYTKWLDDLEEAQRANGAFPDYAPYPMQHGSPQYSWGTAWMDAGVIVPYSVYKAYGDTRVIDRHWDSMMRFIEFRKSLSPDLRGTKKGNSWGDWLAIGSATPLEYVDAAYFAYSAKLMGEMATAAGKEFDQTLYPRIRTVFQKDYVKQDCSLEVNTQTAYVLALSYDLIPANCRQAASDRLASMIEANGFHMTTGFLGTYPLLPVLSATGHHDLAVRMFQSREFPSWGYEVANGATTIWERWNSYTKEKGIHEPSMNSFSHYAFGAVSEWMFKTLAGIDAGEAGFKTIVIRPGVSTANSIDWVKAEYDSIRGKIVCNWKRVGGRFELEVTIPANTKATIYLPSKTADGITMEGKVARPLGVDGNRAVFEVESGSYRFGSRL